MLNKLLQEIVTVIVGKTAEGIVPLLNTKKHVNEFTLAKKLEITINQTRNILYKISNYGLVSSIRKKDKKKGWYTYYWKFEMLKCLEFLDNFLREKKSELEGELKSRETKVFYVCELCQLEYREDEALLMDFSCDECGELFVTKDNSKLIRELKRNIAKIEGRLVTVESEMEIERSKLEKTKQVGLKKEEKEKELKKEEAKVKRALKKKEKEKELGTLKKAVKKKKIVAKKKVIKKKITKKKPAKKKVVKKKKIVAKKKVGKKKVIKKSTKKTSKKVLKKKVAKKKK